jgi:DNA repair protein RadC
MTTIRTQEFKLVPLRDALPPGQMALADTPEGAVSYIRAHVHSADTFRPDVESFAVLFLNTRRRVIGHMIVSTGTLDTILVHPREVFRPAILANAASLILTHNHPSGDPTPSEADIKVTRDLIRAGQLLKMEVLDHVITGHPQEARGFSSLRELGYFYA